MWTRWTVKTISSEIEITQRDLDYLQFIFDAGPSRTSAIHEYFNAGKTKQVTYRRLDELAALPYAFLVKPRKQRQRENANYRDLIYDITKDGIDLLIAYGRIDERHAEWRSLLIRGSFWHAAMSAQRHASFRLGMKQAGIQYISKFEFFERMKIAPKANPMKVNLGTGHYIPDDLIGAVYPNGIKVPFFFEDDLRNEPTERIKSVGSDYISKIERIENSGGNIRSHFGLVSTNPIYLTVTTSLGHMHDMMKKVKRFKPETRERLGFMTEATFDPLTETEYDPCEPCNKCKRRGRVPKPFDARCFTRPYLRVGFDPLNVGGEVGEEDCETKGVV